MIIFRYKFTLLARGSRYGLLGSPDGKDIIPAAIWAIDALAGSGLLIEPVRVPAPPASIPKIGGFHYQIDESIPKDVILVFSYYTCPLTGITIYVTYCRVSMRWYVRELRESGNYFREDNPTDQTTLPRVWGIEGVST